MNGASVVMVIFLLVALGAGMVFLVDQLNRNAEEIMAARATIQDLQENLGQAQIAAVRQQQVIDGLTVSLSQKSAALDQSQAELIHLQQTIEGLNAAVSQQSSELDQLRLALKDEQMARTSAEQRAAALDEQARQLNGTISSLQDQVAALAAQKDANEGRQVMRTSALVPVTGGAAAGSSASPWAVPAAGLLLAGGLVAWGRHERHVHASAAHADRVAVWMTPDQARAYAHFTRSQSARVSTANSINVNDNKTLTKVL